MSDFEKNKNETGKTQQDTQNTDSKASGRRKLLKAGGVVASSALVPEKWSKPVVDTVLLPAHAQTSAPLIGPILVRGAVSTTRTPASMMAKAGSGIVDTFISQASAGGMVSPTPSPTSPTPSPTSPTPSPTSPTPSPTGCPAIGQCVGVVPPNAANQVAFSITNVGSGMLNMVGPLAYSGIVAGLSVSGSFTDQSFSTTTGDVTGLGCLAAYTATLGGTCTPGTPTPTPS